MLWDCHWVFQRGNGDVMDGCRTSASKTSWIQVQAVGVGDLLSLEDTFQGSHLVIVSVKCASKNPGENPKMCKRGSRRSPQADCSSRAGTRKCSGGNLLWVFSDGSVWFRTGLRTYGKCLRPNDCNHSYPTTLQTCHPTHHNHNAALAPCNYGLTATLPSPATMPPWHPATPVTMPPCRPAGTVSVHKRSCKPKYCAQALL